MNYSLFSVVVSVNCTFRVKGKQTQLRAHFGARRVAQERNRKLVTGHNFGLYWVIVYILKQKKGVSEPKVSQ